ncbi:DUF1206 domain-containing protein [Actinoallomurus sp. NPDC052274]|uniref:DUF1206 domain-containing protein n=1 Tax=Actinoallomurus sp. NPDC052274 TaxID=3155420 RepID=UPI00341C50B3
MTAHSAHLRAAGRRASNSTPFQLLARSGLAARGLNYLLVGYLAIKIAFGKGGHADRQGALETVAKTTGGSVILWLLALGFAGLALWRYSEALLGQSGPDGHKATKRLASLARGVFYTGVCATTVAFIIGAGGRSSSDKKSKDYTAKAMHEIPAGRWLVLLVGIGFIAGGIGIAVGAVRRNFEKQLKTEQMSARVRRVVEALGMVGRSTRALVFAAAGVFLAYAAITFDPGKAKGVDGTLREFASTSVGPWLLVLVAFGLVVFGLYSFCEARWRRV